MRIEQLDRYSESLHIRIPWCKIELKRTLFSFEVIIVANIIEVYDIVVIISKVSVIFWFPLDPHLVKQLETQNRIVWKPTYNPSEPTNSKRYCENHVPRSMSRLPTELYGYHEIQKRRNTCWY